MWRGNSGQQARDNHPSSSKVDDELCTALQGTSVSCLDPMLQAPRLVRTRLWASHPEIDRTRCSSFAPCAAQHHACSSVDIQHNSTVEKLVPYKRQCANHTPDALTSCVCNTASEEAQVILRLDDCHFFEGMCKCSQDVNQQEKVTSAISP